MNDVLKQRVVGALILLALGVAFWPIIFVEPDAGDTGVAVEEQSSIDPPPDLPSAAIAVGSDATELPDTVVAIGDSQPAEELSVNDSPAENLDAGASKAVVATPKATAAGQVGPAVGEARSEPPARPTVASDTALEEWTLQVATVSNAEKAESLRRELSAMKHTVYVTTVQAGGKNLYRVCIGRTRTRVELEKLQAGINARFGVTSLVARYSP